jgi:hypothetical protein
VSPLTTLTTREGDLVNPATGDVVSRLDATTEQLAEVRNALVELDRERTYAIEVLDAEIVRRTDQAIAAGDLTSRTFSAGAYKVEVDPPDKRADHPRELHDELDRRAEEFGLSPDAIEHLFVYKPYLSRRAWNNLVQHFPALREVRERHSHLLRRGVTVTRTNLIEGTAKDER